MSLEIFIDTSKYSQKMAEVLTARLAIDIWSRAQNIVAVDTGNLRASGRVAQIDATTWETYFATAYAAAQEYGRPDIKKKKGKGGYNFTPYLRPATRQVASSGTFNAHVKAAEKIARSMSSV
jgi:hypothetical protein